MIGHHCLYGLPWEEPILDQLGWDLGATTLTQPSHLLAHVGSGLWACQTVPAKPATIRYEAAIMSECVAVIVRTVSLLAVTNACGVYHIVLLCASTKIPAVTKSPPHMFFLFIYALVRLELQMFCSESLLWFGVIFRVALLRTW